MPHPSAKRGRRALARSLGTLLAVGALSACLFERSPAVSPRPKTWAEKVPSRSLKNWYKVDEGVYRSEQPGRRGFEEIKAIGIRTVVNLRSRHTDDDEARGLGLLLIRVPMTAGGFGEEEVVAALKAILEAPKPVLFHCQHGSDRAGLVSAMYRVVVQGWTKDEAVAELLGGGYGFHVRYTNIPAFIRAADIEGIRRRLGLAPRGA